MLSNRSTAPADAKRPPAPLTRAFVPVPASAQTTATSIRARLPDACTRIGNHYSMLAALQQVFGLGCPQHTCDTANVVPPSPLFETE